MTSLEEFISQFDVIVVKNTTFLFFLFFLFFSFSFFFVCWLGFYLAKFGGTKTHLSKINPQTRRSS